jgi:uncharacterized integral membrane protein
MHVPAAAAIVLATGKSGIGGIAPILLPDVPLLTVLLFGALNPATITVAFLMGRRADAPAKLLVAAFAAAIAGAALIWFGTQLRLGFLATPARAAAGIFAAGFIFALGWAAIGYAGSNARPKS